MVVEQKQDTRGRVEDALLGVGFFVKRVEDASSPRGAVEHACEEARYRRCLGRLKREEKGLC